MMNTRNHLAAPAALKCEELHTPADAAPDFAGLEREARYRRAAVVGEVIANLLISIRNAFGLIGHQRTLLGRRHGRRAYS